MAIVYKSLPQYRLAFYEKLRLRLDRESIRLRVIYGQPSPVEATKGDTVHIEWGEYLPSRLLPIGDRTLYWQPVFRRLKNVDLVIVEQASKLLVNPLLIGWRRLGGPRVAFWGHGRNLQKHAASPLGEALKERLSTKVDWWFAYTSRTADIVESLGFPRDRITVVQNAIDTSSLSEIVTQTTDEDLDELKIRLGIKASTIALYIGGLYQEKRLDFLAATLKEIYSQLDDFEAIVIGGGTPDNPIQSLANEYQWVHYLGPLFGRAKVQIALLGDVILMPGLVGLAVVDAFVLQRPLITTDIPYHSPEIEYIEDGVNGLILPATVTPKEYAEATVELLRDDTRLTTLRKGCAESARRYTLEEMVERFAHGVERALQD